MKISIVTISYNQDAFLEQAMRSVLDQDYPDIEYIIVDPGSTDNSRAIIERYRPRLASVIFEPDSGPADGLNHGLAAATGDIFGYLNSDDRLFPGALARVAAEFAHHPDADVVYGHGYIEDLRGETKCYRLMATGPMVPWFLAFGGVNIVQQSTFFRTCSVRKAGGFNPENHTCWDYELLIALVLANQRFRKLDADLAVFTMHDRSITGSTSRARQYYEDIRRLNTKLLHRPPHRLDALLAFLAQGMRWILNPRAFWARLQRLFNPHQSLPCQTAPRPLIAERR